MFMFLIQLLGQILSIYLFKWTDEEYYNTYGGFDNNQEYYNENEDFRLDSVEGLCIFIFTSNIYLFSVLAFNISKPWRK